MEPQTFVIVQDLNQQFAIEFKLSDVLTPQPEKPIGPDLQEPSSFVSKRELCPFDQALEHWQPYYSGLFAAISRVYPDSNFLKLNLLKTKTRHSVLRMQVGFFHPPASASAQRLTANVNGFDIWTGERVMCGTWLAGSAESAVMRYPGRLRYFQAKWTLVEVEFTIASETWDTPTYKLN